MLNFVNGLGSEALLEILLLSKDATAIYTSEDLRIQLVNNAMLALWGKDRSIQGLRFEDALPELKGQPFTELLKKVWRTGETFTAKDTPATLEIDGQLKTSYFDFIYRAIHDGQGQVRCILHTATDVTDRMAAWELVRLKGESERQIKNDLRQANEKLNQSIQDLEALNEEYESTNEELHNTNEALAAINEEYQATNEELQTTLEELSKLNWEYNSANEQLRITSEKLAESQQTLDIAMQSARLGNYQLDINTGKMDCSVQCKANFGLEADVRFDLGDLMTAILPAHREMVQQNIQIAISERKLYQAEYQVQWPDGSFHWIMASGTPHFDEQGQVVKMTGITQRITERKDFELRKDEFLSVASHELKTPLTALKANLQLLDRIKERSADASLVKLIENANRTMGKVTAMVDELLDMGKYSRGLNELNKSRFELSALLENAFSHLPEDLQKKIILEAEPLEVFADEQRIEQVVANLVNNGVKYAPQSKSIRLRLFAEEETVKVTVSDQGDGIAPERIPKLFERYYQAERGQQQAGSLGLGLYICSEIIKRHGGHIGVESVVGKGSDFWFTLPLSQSKA